MSFRTSGLIHVGKELLHVRAMVVDHYGEPDVMRVKGQNSDVETISTKPSAEGNGGNQRSGSFGR